MKTEVLHGPNPLALLMDACASRGCHLEDQFNIEKLRHEVVHWETGEEWWSQHITMPTIDAEVVKVWIRSLHG